MENETWIGVAFDEALVHKIDYNSDDFGKPVDRMVKRIRSWLSNGQEVRIVTTLWPDRDNFDPREMSRVRDWCEKHIGERLIARWDVDGMSELWSARVVQCDKQSGEPLKLRTGFNAS